LNENLVDAMPGTIFSNRIFSALRRFARADQGNIAVMFAFAALPILAAVGAAIDYSRVNNARTSLQAALDSTALMVSKDLADKKIVESEIDAKAKSYFAALYTGKIGTVSSSEIHATYTPMNSKGISNVLITGHHADRLHKGRRLPGSQIREQFHLRVGQYPDAGGDGAG
jgi:Flp pilus assembly protein TadG